MDNQTKFKIAQEEGQRVYEEHRDELEREHMGEYVMIVEGKLIDHNPKFSELQKKHLERLIEQDKYAYVRRVGEKPSELVGPPVDYFFLVQRGAL